MKDKEPEGMKRLRKLKERKGESVAEALVSLVIASLGMVLLAGMITASVNLITESRDTISDYVTADNRLETREGSALSGTASVKDDTGREMRLTDGDASSQIPVYYYSNTEIGSTPVISYRLKAE